MAALTFRVHVTLLAAEMGGRHTPIRSGYRTIFVSEALGVRGSASIQLETGTTIAPAAEGAAKLTPLVPVPWSGASIGDVFEIREGARVVGHATITAVVREAFFTPGVIAFAEDVRELCAVVDHGIDLDREGRFAGLVRSVLEHAPTLPDLGEPDEPVPNYPLEPRARCSEDVAALYADLALGLHRWDIARYEAAIRIWRAWCASRWGARARAALTASAQV